jgi:hypothetical protein
VRTLFTCSMVLACSFTALSTQNADRAAFRRVVFTIMEPTPILNQNAAFPPPIGS